MASKRVGSQMSESLHPQRRVVKGHLTCSVRLETLGRAPSPHRIPQEQRAAGRLAMDVLHALRFGVSASSRK